MSTPTKQEHVADNRLDEGRRLLILGLASALPVGVAARLASESLASGVEAEVIAPASYRETEHVRKFYELSRF